MYVEYSLPLDKQINARDEQQPTQQPHFDRDGNVWYTDRSVPNRIGRVDPRAGKFKDWMMPDPKADPHGLARRCGRARFVDGAVGFSLGRLDPETARWCRYPMAHSTGQQKGRGHSPIMDSKQNVWFAVIQQRHDRQVGPPEPASPPPDFFGRRSTPRDRARPGRQRVVRRVPSLQERQVRPAHGAVHRIRGPDAAVADSRLRHQTGPHPLVRRLQQRQGAPAVPPQPGRSRVRRSPGPLRALRTSGPTARTTSGSATAARAAP